ncbi:MAG TPA: bifunctional 4-hydroxy-2-oxoglutarate aldolase/2-dehydro-3-deoxy-phosphogluconate aldolase [Candidatus Acidoferrum sp.]|jgi:2-dehydro-3-deoxyphosphogluconate aldolase/(4S)-4-hydroxy-2-oxoglutarate aldolase
MNAQEALNAIHKVGIIPVIRAGSAAEAVLAAEAMEEGGIPLVEITMTVPCAIEAIRKVRAEFGARILVGAGTVLTEAQAKECFDAGAEFLVSPGLSLPVLQVATTLGKLAIPGVLTPTELMTAMGTGVSAMKVFPCGNVGGPKYIKALRGPFPNALLIPTGGVSHENAAEYFAAGAFAIGVGGELVNAAALRTGRKSEIAGAARELAAIVNASRKL